MQPTMAALLSVPEEQLGASHSAVELPQFRRVGSNESRKSNSSSSPSPANRHSQSSWDLDTYCGEKSMISLTSADEEKWIFSQVSNPKNSSNW